MEERPTRKREKNDQPEREREERTANKKEERPAVEKSPDFVPTSLLVVVFSSDCSSGNCVQMSFGC